MSENWFSWKRVSPRCWVAADEGGNSLAIACEGEAILVDTKMPGFGAVLRREAEAVCGVPIRTVINTHHHRDHVGGNNAFTPDCVVMMHENGIARVGSLGEKIAEAVKGALIQVSVSDRVERTAVLRELHAFAAVLPAIDSFVPNRIVQRSESLTIGGVGIELIHLGSGHSDNDLIVWIPSENVLHSGDLIFNHAWPYVDRSGGMQSAGWIAGCEKILERCDAETVVVPGHGAVDRREAAARQRDLLLDLRARAEHAVGSGIAREKFLSSALDEYRALGRAERLKPMALGGFWDEAAEASTG